jgi:hypothetical protein
MKTLLLFVLLVVFTGKSFGQLARVDPNIKKLDNSQFTIIHGEKPMFSMNSPASIKLKKAGKRAAGKLIMALEDSTKVIMAHLTLCHIYFNVATFAGPKTKTVNDKTVYYYFLGQKNGEGLIINEVKNNGAYRLYIEPEDLKSIITYWKNIYSKKG